MKIQKLIITLLFSQLLIIATGMAAGTLTPVGSNFKPIEIRDHHIDVVINNGFAMTEVTQTFYNPNDRDLEALYSFPLPKTASLSEVTIYAGENEINGEVLEKGTARKVYESERDKGNNTGLAEKNGYQSFDFSVSPIPATDETRIRFVYYQPISIDTGIGRYNYPLEEGGTDDTGSSFWLQNDNVTGDFSANVTLKSSWPLVNIRVPGYENEAAITRVDDGIHEIELIRHGGKLNRDFIIYYRLQENLPGRVELMAYRSDKSKPGTFMMIMTPGLDLQPINRGADYTFVLDISGSMASKIHTLANGVEKTLEQFHPNDRFRIITFNTRAKEITNGWVAATEENVQTYVVKVKTLGVNGGTNLYSGIDKALKNLDDDRATSIILVTDAVTNTGIVRPQEFYKLMKQYDVRIFGFVMGNSGNWPLMRMICNVSGGFAKGVSNDDDILGQMLLAKNKIAFECLHDAKLSISDVKTYDISNKAIGKIYRGQQLVFLGKYEKGGTASITLDATLTGKDKHYTTTFDFPDIDTTHPELERLWALDQIEMIENLANAGLTQEKESKKSILNLGLQYQIVTDETSMVVLSDSVFEERGIERRNRDRVAIERQAQVARKSQPRQNHRVDQKKPMFKHHAPSVGGGAVGPWMVGLIIGLLGFTFRIKSSTPRDA